MINVYINEKCNGCGGCLYSDYFEEMDNGDVQVKAGVIIPDDVLDEITALSNDCPCQAIIIDNEKKYSEELVRELLGYIDNIQDIEHIENVDEVAMSNMLPIKFNYSITRSQDGFHSYNKVENALRSEIHCIWDDRKDYALRLAQEYVNYELRRFWDIDYPQGIYWEVQSNIKKAVHAISNALYSAGIIECELSEKDYCVEFTQWVTRWLLEPECISKEWAQRVNDRLDSGYMSIALHKAQIESYTDYFDKKRTRWMYSQGGNCEEEIKSQIISKLISVSKYDAKKEINRIIDEYNKQLQEIREKLNALVKNNILGETNKQLGFHDNGQKENIACFSGGDEENRKSCSSMVKLTQEMIERREYGIPYRRGHVSYGTPYYDAIEHNTEASDFCLYVMFDKECQKEMFEKHVKNTPDFHYVIFLQDYFYRKYKGYRLPYFELPMGDTNRLELYNQTALDSGHPEYMVDDKGKEIRGKYISTVDSTDVIYLSQEMVERREYGIPFRKGSVSYDSAGTVEYNTVRSDFCNCFDDEDSKKEFFLKHIKDSSDVNYVKFLQDYFYRKYKGYWLPYFELPQNDSKRFQIYNNTALESGHPEYMVNDMGEPIYEEWFYFE